MTSIGGSDSPCCSAIHSRSQRPRVCLPAGRNQASNCCARLGSTVAVIISSGISRTLSVRFARRLRASCTVRREHSRQPRRRRGIRGWRGGGAPGRGECLLGGPRGGSGGEFFFGAGGG